MQKKTVNRILTGTLAAGMLLTSGIPYNVLAQSSIVSNEIDNAEQVLMNLSAEQRNALEQLEAKADFTISPNIDVHSPELVNVIVEFNQDPAKIEVMKQAVKGKRMTTASAASKVEEVHQEFKNYVNSMKKQRNANVQDTKITREYSHAIVGVAMTVPGTAVEELLQSGVVKRVWKDEVVQLELPASPQSASESKMMDSIPQIGVDKLHAEEVTGKGIQVGVLDTGIDYNHPDLQGAYQGYRAVAGTNPKTVDPSTVKGWDFVDNDADPMETTYQNWKNSKKAEFDSNGNAYYTSHGTHVSGTIAGEQKNNVDYAVKGVAPDVDLYTYRVLGPYGSGTTTNVLGGIDKAITDGMDVINLSLGANVNDPLYATSVAINNAMLSGVVSVVAAGNAGPNERTVGSPGTAALAITVGASDFAMNIPTFASMSANDQTFNSVKLLGKNFTDILEELQNQSAQVVFAGLGKPADFVGKDVKGKIALIQRGEITFDAKIKNAAQAGAKAVIVYNNVEGEIPAYVGEGIGLIPAFRLTQADGERLKALGDNIPLTFGTLINTATEGDTLAAFSSRGPVNKNEDIKPDVVAPGVAIFSTYPEYMNSPQDGIDYTSAYMRLQGTSMATPHVAGVAALLLQSHPDYSPFDVKAAMMNTAVDLKGEYSVHEQGAGRVDAYRAVHTDISIKVLDKTQQIENGKTVEVDDPTGSIVFGRQYKQEGKLVEASKKVTIQNRGTEEKTFKVEVEYHGARDGIQDAVKNGIQVTVPESVTVAGGQTQEIQPKLTIPYSAASGRYEGYIHVTNTNNPEETYQIPFSTMVNKKGIAYLKTFLPSMTNDTQYWQYLIPSAVGFFKLNSPMKTIDMIMKDGKTGKAIGFIGTINSSTAQPDREYMLPQLFTGTVYLFTNDPANPISDIPMKVPEGEYVIELIAHDEEGKSYVANTPLIVDNTPPEVNMDTKPGVIEINDSMYTVEDGEKAFWLHGTVKDATVNVLQSKGLEYDQSSNKMAFYVAPSAFIKGHFPIEANGDVKFGIEESDIATKPMQLTLASYDMASVVGYQTYYFLKEGTQYTTSRYNKQEVSAGDTVTMTLSFNNVKQLVSGEFDVEFMKDYFQFVNVTPNDAIKQYAKEKGLELSVEEPVVTEGTSSNIVKVGAALTEQTFSGLDEDMPFLDVTFKVVNDEVPNVDFGFRVKQAFYKKAGQTENTAIPYYGTESFKIIAKHSRVDGYIGPEAFKTSSGSLIKADYTELGVKVYAVSPSGKKYKGTIINDRGAYVIQGIPASNQIHTLVIDVPGHVQAMKKFIPGYVVKGDVRGQNVRFSALSSLAGDVNGDGIIDLLDALILSIHYGKEDVTPKKGDINQDGVVNETDIRFIEKNYLQKGPNAKPDQKLVESIGSMTLEKILRSIGLEPK
ncbi:S8 family serine peptidase [Bacillus sp. 165]|uniref:S8 family serine peptidase n=1 Tax=Bacillus sp. 165 TaxID=1529117 RepID=UPI001ADD4787|nr:S8 family serine peptidase [Bacillus sp. 165]MBO9129457.1 S8 family serine peptidase [Bacillus sp. 165]